MQLGSISLAAMLAASFVMRTATVAAAIPLPEHPRPDRERSAWINLNGEWDFTFDHEGRNFDRHIVVPFGWGSPLSGVEAPPASSRQANTRRALTGKEPLNDCWYRREITVPADWKGRRVFVVVGAADHSTVAWLDGQRLGTHEGGYTPFEFELTPFVKFGERQTLKFYIEDQQRADRLFGKQGYGNVHGIWQTVYLEARPRTYLRHVHFRPDLDKHRVLAEVELDSPAKESLAGAVEFKPEDRKEPAKFAFAPGEMIKTVEIPLEIDLEKIWDLDHPYLYEVKAKLQGGDGEDCVSSYFGMRKISVGRLPGTDYPYVFLNDKPIYLRMALDQSYTPEGFYTFPSDEYMRREIEIAKQLGLNGDRVHIKVEVPRKLYWADRLGLLIMADVPNWWGDPCDGGFKEHEFTFREMVERDMNHPSIFSWVLFNETWGLLTEVDKRVARRGETYLPETQARVARVWRMAKALDPTRLVEDMSPCSYDHVVSDFNSWHHYAPGWQWEETLDRICDRAAKDATFGYVDGRVGNGGPMFNSECGNVWGYAGNTGDCDWSWDYHQMMDAFRRHPRCAGWLYTEHHDVTNEWNGYVKADRSWKETGIEELFPDMSLKDLHGDVYLALDKELFHEADAGATLKVPVTLSAMTDSIDMYEELEIAAKIRAWNADGRLVEKDLGKVFGPFTAKEWHQGKVGEVSVTLPDEVCVGTVNFELAGSYEYCAPFEDGDALMRAVDVVARNFTTFATRAKPDASRVGGRLVASEWSLGATNVLGGLKVCGIGKGYFDYEFALPRDATSAEFVAELSTRPQLGKDLGGKGDDDMAAMLGLATCDPTANPNAYQMTDDRRHPGRVEVSVNGRTIGEATLVDDPADHRGILSWGHQDRGAPDDFNSRRLHDAGTYGYIVRMKIPGDVIAAAKDAITVRLAAPEGTGLSVYGEKFGRYPTGPVLVFNRKGNE